MDKPDVDLSHVVVVVYSPEEDPFPVVDILPPFPSVVDVNTSFPSVVDEEDSFSSVVDLLPPFRKVVVVYSLEEDPFPSVVDVLSPFPSVVDLLSPLPAVGVVSSPADVTVLDFEQFLGSYDDPGQLMDPEKTFFLLCSSLFTKVPFSLFSQHTFGFPLFVDPLKTQ